MFILFEQNKTSKELSEVEIDNLADKEFKVVIVNMIKELRRRMDSQSEMLEIFNKELENMENQAEMRNTITEMKNTLEGINSRLRENIKSSKGQATSYVCRNSYRLLADLLAETLQARREW